MYTTAAPAWSPDPTKPTVHIYIDNSNLFIGGKRAYAERHSPHLTEDPSWRVGFDDVLITELLHPILDAINLPRENIGIHLYGSQLPFKGPLKTASGLTINTHSFKRSAYSGKEKRVDTSLTGDLGMSVGRNYGVKDGVHYVVVSGDWDVAGEAIRRLRDTGFPLHIWAWELAMASGLQRATPGTDLTVHYLDDILDRITLFNPDTPPPMHPRSLVILNAPTDHENKQRVDDIFWGSSVQWKWDEIDGHLVIVPLHDDTEDDKKQQLALDRFTRVAKDSYNLEKLGCQVLTLEEYRAGRRPVRDEARDERHPNDSRLSRMDNESGINNNNTPRSLGQGPQFWSQEPCRFGGNCGRGLDCTYKHTREERETFETRRDGKLKTVLCRNGRDCPRRPEDCSFAHGKADLVCQKCGGLGHEKRHCPGNMIKNDDITNKNWR